MTVAQRSRAADTIARKGQTVTVVGASAGNYAPATSTVTPTSYSKSVKGLLLPMNPFRKAGNDNIKEGDEQLLLAALDTAGAALPPPPVNATVTLANGSKATLIAVSRLDPDGEGSIIFDCVVRANA